MPDASPLSRRWTVIGSGLLCCALALVVIYTNRSAFFSPLAVVVVAAIGLAAVLLQLRARGRTEDIHSPTWLTVLGIVFALGAAFADVLHFSSELAQILALGAVGVFGISGAIILHGVRKHRIESK
jgi:drug/metabolite transporter (DMT)-like permease